MKKPILFFTFLSVALGSHLAYSFEVLKLKNYREIYASYQGIMNVDGRDTELTDLYRLDKDRLPQTGSPQEFSSPTVLALTELGGAFCKKAIDAEKVVPLGERTLFSRIDFERGPEQFTGYLQEALFEDLSQAFWGRDIKDSEKIVLSKIMTDTLADLQSTTETEKVLEVVCTTYASSLAFVTK